MGMSAVLKPNDASEMQSVNLTYVEVNCADSGSPLYKPRYHKDHASAEVWSNLPDNQIFLKSVEVRKLTQREAFLSNEGKYYIRTSSQTLMEVNVY